MIKVKRLKEILSLIEDGELEIFIRDSTNSVGNISSLEQIEISSYGFFGEDIPCLIFNTSNSKDLEVNEFDDVIDYIKTTGR